MARAVKPARGSFFARLFGQHKAGQGFGGNPECAQGAEGRAAFLERQPGDAVNHEEAHGEGQKAKGGQVQVEAVGQPGGIGGVGLAQGGAGQEGGKLARVGGDRAGQLQPVDLAGALQQALGGSDISEQQASGGLVEGEERWQAGVCG